MAAKTDSVIAFPGVRVAREPATLIIGASLEQEPRSVHRVFGINDQLDFKALARVLSIVFGWGAREGHSVPTRFQLPGSSVEAPIPLAVGNRARAGNSSSARAGEAGKAGALIGTERIGYVDIPLGTQIAEVLQDPGDTLIWQWGLWTHMLQVREAFARDEATPDALCIGGSGTVHALGEVEADQEVDIAAINRELTGQDSIESTLAATRSDVVDLIEDSGVFEFVPLLQALDLKRSESSEVELRGEVGDGVVKRLRALPLESATENPAGHAAALVEMLCLAALTSDELRHDVASHVMERLGWETDDGFALSGEDVEELAAESWAEMCALGLAGQEALPPVARLDLLREALRR